MYNIKPVKKTKVSDEIFTQMQMNIKNGIWKHNSKLPSENMLAELFDVSRISIRTAIHKLEAIGMLETRNGEGTFVVDVNPRDIWAPVIKSMSLGSDDMIETFEFRRLIESHCCAQVANSHQSEDIESLLDCIDHMKKAADINDIEQYTCYDEQFHANIVEIAGNKIIFNIYSILSEVFHSQILHMNREFGVELGLKYHVLIYQAICDGDSQKASELVNENVNQNILHLINHTSV